MTEDKKPIDKSRRAVILATVGIVVIMSLAMVYVAVAAPFLRTRKLVADCHERFAFGPYPPDIESRPDSAIKEFGGTERTSRALVSYLHWPRWVAPHRETAVGLLGYCGKPGLPTLIALARDKTEPKVVRLTAIHYLDVLSWPTPRVSGPPFAAPFQSTSSTSVPDSAEIERLIKTVCEAWDLPYESPAPDTPEGAPKP